MTVVASVERKTFSTRINLFESESRVYRSFWSPQVILNGQRVFISDANSKSGMIECESKDEARRKARQIRDELNAKSDKE